jgi:hypothetical protein
VMLHNDSAVIACSKKESAGSNWLFRRTGVNHFASEHAALVGGDHVLDVDVCVLSSVFLQDLKGLLDQIGKVLLLALSVVDLVSDVH